MRTNAAWEIESTELFLKLKVVRYCHKIHKAHFNLLSQKPNKTFNATVNRRRPRLVLRAAR